MLFCENIAKYRCYCHNSFVLKADGSAGDVEEHAKVVRFGIKDIQDVSEPGIVTLFAKGKKRN